MSSEILTHLAWLPLAEDFREGCQALRSGQGAFGRELRRLATHALTLPQLQRLAALVDDLQAQGRACDPLTPVKLGLIGDGTLDVLARILRSTGARHGLLIDCVKAAYGQAVQEALSADSAINRAGCQVVFVALDYRSLPLNEPVATGAEAADRVEHSLEIVRSICQGLRAHSSARIVLQTLAPPPEPLFGSLDAMVPGAVANMIGQFNLALVKECEDPAIFLLDTARLAAAVGLANWHAPTQWNMAKLPFALDLAPLYADHVCRLLGAMHGKARRALVLDLDNTLWGGVIGDDGMEGILLGEGDATGEAHLSVQRMALALRSRGIVLAVSSKNNDEVAREPFRQHPEMLLKEEHIAVFRANWDDKASNIRMIAEELALGLDAFVFLDDNPAERAIVRRYLPEVAVPELPEDPALYARTLASAGYFEAVVFSDEDRTRADAYQANAQRTALKQSATNVEDFLAALNMRAKLQPFDAVGRARIAQLVAKSNQFNLTTRRYTEAEVRELEEDPDTFTLQVRLEDRLGDNGMISVAVCRPGAPKTWDIETWLMSCRVLGRGVEKLVLKEMLEEARRAGVETLVGIYRPTERNGMVRDHYEKLGFTFQRDGAEGETYWSLSTATQVEAPWFSVLRPEISEALAAI